MSRRIWLTGVGADNKHTALINQRTLYNCRGLSSYACVPVFASPRSVCLSFKTRRFTHHEWLEFCNEIISLHTISLWAQYGFKNNPSYI